MYVTDFGVGFGFNFTFDMDPTSRCHSEMYMLHHFRMHLCLIRPIVVLPVHLDPNVGPSCAIVALSGVGLLIYERVKANGNSVTWCNASVSGVESVQTGPPMLVTFKDPAISISAVRYCGTLKTFKLSSREPSLHARERSHHNFLSSLLSIF
jgi:hypothetical protein